MTSDGRRTPRERGIVRAARGWIGTPYHHQASRRGVGCDCLGLVRGVWREVYGAEPETPGPYTADWGEAGRTETLLDAAGRWLDPVPCSAALLGEAVAPANVLIFRMRRGAIAKHTGIATGAGTMIHAAERCGVVEVRLGSGWLRRMAGLFSFPEGDG